MKKKRFQQSTLLGLFFVILFAWLLGVDAESIKDTMPVLELKPVIVIDPGHGGHDVGALGPKKKQEKVVTMAMAKEILSCLEGRYDIILTRTDDYWLDVHSRASIANHHGGALFLSIHAGGSFSHQSEGISIYHYGYIDQSGEEADMIFEYSEGSSISKIPWDNIQKPYLIKSEILAEMIQAELSKSGGYSEIKIHEAPILLLSGINMPCVVVEIGCLTNPLAEKDMADKSWLSEFAGKICAGIDVFIKKEHGVDLGLQ